MQLKESSLRLKIILGALTIHSRKFISGFWLGYFPSLNVFTHLSTGSWMVAS